MSELYDDVSLGRLAELVPLGKRLIRLNNTFDAAAVSLGASTCAEGSVSAKIFG